MEKTIESKNCKQCSGSFDIAQSDRDFYTKISPTFGGKKYQIPDPTLCPECRQQRRLCFRNERNLYKRKCNATGKDIISMHSPANEIKVYSEEFWWSDGWEGLDYGFDLDSNTSFFKQFNSLFQTVPQPALINNFMTLNNSNYSNYSGHLGDCYLAYECGSCDSLLYGESCRHTTNCIDMSMTTRCEECYFCFNIFDCYKVFFSTNSHNCSDSYYLKDCYNCKFCYNCEQLSDKSYCIKNIQYSQGDYFKKIEQLPKTYDLKLFRHVGSDKVALYMNGEGNENVRGDYIFN